MYRGWCQALLRYLSKWCMDVALKQHRDQVENKLQEQTKTAQHKFDLYTSKKFGFTFLLLFKKLT